ncbi:Vacuolar protein-sorting-associated protein 28 [Apophysomyces sp. BC1034]|nr:Vacuolar protein-sorting-associated protein 28 [Apophysomyces sp. BC1015]KAG0183418.1 Vacuolar protein-sorting-associated protein 28 [Apophysomyces sp. BC1021]KAG0193786.1 Vacuolar protein-sorting-associated protein 28 [Apophysomyces sp. BC1034]
MTSIHPSKTLDTIHNHISKTWFIKKQGKEGLEEHLDSILDHLDDLIQWSYDRYTNIELEDGREEEKEEEANQIQSQHISQANQMASSVLVKIVAGEMVVGDDKDDERMERAARILAHLSGRGAAGAITRTWHIPYLDRNGDRNEIQIKLHEPSFIGNDIGFKTWGAAPLLAKKLIQQNIIADMPSRHVLELGTGTGMVGLVCGILGASEVHVTDYHPRVLENVAININLNQSQATVSKLDFIEVATGNTTEWKDKKFDLVIASDLLYEMEHAEHLPVAVEKLMENEFYFMIPLRDTHWNEVHRFEEKMEQVGLFKRRTIDSEKQEEEGIVRYRYYEYTR